MCLSPLSMAVCQDTPSFNSVGRVSSPPDLGEGEDAELIEVSKQTITIGGG